MYRPLSYGCLHKIHISDSHSDRYVECGTCIACRLKKSNRLARLGYLDALRCDCVFVTLTYDNANLPYCDCLYDKFTSELIFYQDDEILSVSYCNERRYKNLQIISKHYQRVLGSPREGSFRVPVLLQKHQQDYVKRVRERFRKKYGTLLRMQICGEYGPTTQRPHYHVLFQIPSAERDEFRESKIDSLCGFANECWEYGNTYVECANNSVTSYISTYITSGSNDAIPTSGSCFKPFFRHSNFFGFGYITSDSQKCDIYSQISEQKLPNCTRVNKKGQNYELSVMPYDYLRSLLPLPINTTGFDDIRLFARLQFARGYFANGYRPSELAKVIFNDFISVEDRITIDFKNIFDNKTDYLIQNNYDINANNKYLYNWIYRSLMISYKYYKWWKYFGYNEFVTNSFYRQQYMQAKSDIYYQKYSMLKEHDIDNNTIAMYMSDDFNLYHIPDMMPKFKDYFQEIYNRYHYKDKSKKFNDLYFNKVELI